MQRMKSLSRLMVIGAFGVARMVDGAASEAPAMRTIHVTLTTKSEVAAALKGTVTLRDVSGQQTDISLPAISFKEPLAFTVPAKSTWETFVAAPGWWAAPTMVGVAERDGEITLTLTRTGVVSGQMTVPEGSGLPKGLAAVIDVPPGMPTARAGPS
jgi:hypothetical protein